jgi:hypothetical protein
VIASLFSSAFAQPDLAGRTTVAVDRDGFSQAYFLLEPSISHRFSGELSFEGSLRFEGAGRETGLGGTSNFSRISQPVPSGEDDIRAEIGEAFLRLQTGSLTLDLGKQSIAWGSLDGIRVTDQFTPVRLTEGLARTPRPDRIPIWAARLRAKTFGFDIDLAVSPDPTVDQIAEVGDRFFPNAPRFRGGFPSDAPLPELLRDDRDQLVEDGSAGIRIGRTVAGTDIRLVALTGPDHQGVLSVADGGEAVILRHEERTLVGAEVVRPIGPVILRAALSHSPDRLFNTESGQLLGAEERSQWLGGIGADAYVPFGFFSSSQLLFDHVEGPDDLVRPSTDVIATSLLRKRWGDDRWGMQTEILQSLSDGDGLLRAELAYRIADRFDVLLGTDLFYGDHEGIFGQYERQSRVLLGLRL